MKLPVEFKRVIVIDPVKLKLDGVELKVTLAGLLAVHVPPVVDKVTVGFEPDDPERVSDIVLVVPVV